MKDISLSIARNLLKAADRTEAEEISVWRDKSPENASFLKNLELFWNNPGEENAENKSDIARERLLTRINSSEADTDRRSLPIYFQRIAAVLVIALSIAGLSVYIASKTDLFYKNSWVEIATESGQRSKVALPDGSMVWLNAETVIKYHADRKERQVSLTGEAYFEVNHSKDHPFVVDAGDTRIKVLGTKFNVSNYPGTNITEASLIAGKISMTLNETNEVVYMMPGEKVTYDSGKQTLSKSKAVVLNDILWKQGILVFDNTSFNDLITRLERYYAIDFVYDKVHFENIHYTGTINNLNVERVLEFINLTIPINYKIDNKTITLSLCE